MPPTFNGRVLIIEDEPAIADTLSIALDLEGFSTEVVRTGAKGLSSLSNDPDAFVVLDVGLPDQTGFEVLRQIREKYSVPVLMLTARTEEIDRVLGLELGADDYVTKPFSPREVVSRIKAILRRWNKSGASENGEPGPVDTVGPAPASSAASAGAKNDSRFRVDKDGMEIYFLGQKLPLSPYEYGTLTLMLERPGMVFSREQIMDHVWTEPEESFDRAVDTVIKNIRNALRAVDPDQDIIETRRGLGYCIRRESLQG
ncbi:MAG TPA: two-component system response regulator CreB [Leptospiraceae bacterium]|nr:two-component system response regulator CreB [Spirochaetaceae bacterium]HBS03788.1 two-component system response regulator CreB [Leptospiraceae bacterium]|tara:strand:+ start:25519 stop:26289 length:771 start_codon:yes stop_codon:yes gene_type:complete